MPLSSGSGLKSKRRGRDCVCCRYRPNNVQSLHASLNSVVTKRNVEKKKTIEKEKMMFFIYSKNSTPSQVHRKPLRLSPAQSNISSVTVCTFFKVSFYNIAR